MPDLRRWGLAVAVTVLLAAGCAVDPLGAPLLPGEPPVGPPGFPAHQSRGCGDPATLPADTSTQTLVVDAVERTFLLTMPDPGTGPGPHPLLFDFHGMGSNGTQQWFYSRLATKGQPRGYVTITPSAAGGAWVIPPSPADLTFVDAMRRWIGDRACIDLTRVYAAGLSNGSSMTAGLGCHRRDVFAAIGVVAGPNIYPACAEAEPMPYLAFHGTADTVVPYDAGLALGVYPVPGVDAVVDEIAADRNHCTVATVDEIAVDVTRTRYLPCAARADTQLYTVIGGGHTWPGAVVDIPWLGPVTDSIDASELLLDFFDAHRR